MQKEYIAEIKLGVKTDTLDITGNILETKKETINKEAILKVFDNIKGKFTQTIPIYSAKKVNGKKLYEYARNGENVVLPQNEIEIYNIELLSFKGDIVKFKTLVSKGTYIRSLIAEICQRLGIIGTMNNLVRTKQGKFAIQDTFTIKQIQNNEYKLFKASDVLDYPLYNLNDDEFFKVKNGQKMKFNFNEEYVILTYENKEIALYKKEDNLFKVEVMLI